MQLFVEILSSFFIIAGVIFIVISSVGLLRLPDFYIRISVVTKAITLGISLILIGIGIFFNDLVMVTKVMVIICFMMITAPVSAHIIARAAVRNKVPFWGKTLLKEFQPYLEKEQAEAKEQKDEEEQEKQKLQ
jgi:multicomponent Na+:H+ antiporter subunit G